MSTAVEVRITGRVQGVFFRARCADQARGLGVSGWVRNEPDGAVTGHFEGPADAVDALVEWCHAGSPRAQVDDVTVTPADVEGLVSFEAG